MNAAVAAISASAVVGLLVAPATRTDAGATRGWAFVAASALLLVAGVCALAGSKAGCAGTASLAALVLVLALRPARAGGVATASADGDSDGEPGDEPGGGGGGGGLRKPPEDPPPAPPSPGLDWDAFDEAREAWAVGRPERV